MCHSARGVSAVQLNRQCTLCLVCASVFCSEALLSLQAAPSIHCTHLNLFNGATSKRTACVLIQDDRSPVGGHPSYSPVYGLKPRSGEPLQGLLVAFDNLVVHTVGIFNSRGALFLFLSALWTNFDVHFPKSQSQTTSDYLLFIRIIKSLGVNYGICKVVAMLIGAPWSQLLCFMC